MLKESRTKKHVIKGRIERDKINVDAIVAAVIDSVDTIHAGVYSYEELFTNTKWKIVSYFDVGDEHKVRSAVGQEISKGYIFAQQDDSEKMIIVSTFAANRAYMFYRAIDSPPSKMGRHKYGVKRSRRFQTTLSWSDALKDLSQGKPITRPMCLDAIDADEDVFDNAALIDVGAKARKAAAYDPFGPAPMIRNEMQRKKIERTRVKVADVFEEVGSRYGIERV